MTAAWLFVPPSTNGGKMYIWSADPDPVNFYVRLKMEFACTLYHQVTAEMKSLTRGEFVGLFGKF